MLNNNDTAIDKSSSPQQFGHFDDETREYVITNPITPSPWINYLGNDGFFSLISNTSGGYTFYRDAKFRRLTRYRYNNVPLDDGGKYFYICDEESTWSPGWKPMKTPLDEYECRHGMGYTKITGKKNGLSCETLFFVPLGENIEVQRVRIKNESLREKNIKLFSMVEWCLWNAEDDMTNFQRNFSTGQVEVVGSSIYHKTEYRERRNHYAFYSVNQPISGFDTSREQFLGPYNGFNEPQTVLDRHPNNHVSQGWSLIGSHCLDVNLAPGEEKEFIFVLGYVENPEEKKWEKKDVINKEISNEILSRYHSSEYVEQALNKLKDYWDGMLSSYQLQSDDLKLNRLVNIWNQYQCMVTFNMSRSASYYESGIGRGMGFRDSNQDLIGVMHLEPERARERIIDIASTQFLDGSAYHQYQPLTKRGNAAIGGNFNDDPLWLILSTTSYIKETGDVGILSEQVPFDNDESVAKSLFHHLTASFNHVINNLGPHGLPLIGRADWNDCLNLNCFSKDPNESFQTTENREGGVAESLMIAGMFVHYGKDYIDLCKYAGKNSEAERAQKHVDDMSNAVIQHGWDGEWFLRAYDALGKKVGSDEDNEGKIFIESQGFCVMAGLGVEDGKAIQALNSVGEHLGCEYGIVLNYPAFTEYRIELGEISTYPQGYKENGGIFCHNNPWIMIAETVVGRGDKAFDYYCRIAPSYNKDNAALHKTEPYVYSQMISGKEAVIPGEAKNSWLTGTAAWNYHTITCHILGIKPEYDGLMIDPCIPQTWRNYSVKRTLRNINFDIEISNPFGVSKGVKKVTVNGKVIEGNIIAYSMCDKKAVVQVEMG